MTVDTTEPSNCNLQGKQAPTQHANLLSFSMVTIHGVATSKSQPDGLSGYFTRAESFPAPVHTQVKSAARMLPVEEWSPLPSPTEGHLELQLETKLAEGTSGTAYGATVVDSSSPHMADRVCVKWGKGYQCRTLAREAWFYEQLYRTGDCEGIITPRCYGFYTMRFGSLTADGNRDAVLRPWAELENNNEQLLPDDDMDYKYHFQDDKGLKADSPWNRWKQKRGDNRLVAVLILEELGSACQAGPEVEKSVLDDISDIVRDLGEAGITHFDLRHANVLQSLTMNDSAFCPRHKRVHKWRLIDFDRATKTIFGEKNPGDKLRACYRQHKLVGNKYFRGTLIPWTYPYEYWDYDYVGMTVDSD